MSDTFNADEAKSRAEVDLIRAQAEAQRATGQAAKDKAAAEIAQLRMPFFMRATFWTAMIPILTLAAAAVYTVDRGYFQSETKVLQAETNLLKFKKGIFKTQVTKIKSQINEKSRELRAMKKKLAAEPIRVLIDTLKVSDSKNSGSFLRSSEFEEMVRYVKASPDIALPLLEQSAKSMKNPYQRLVLAIVGLASTNDSTWFDSMLAVGRDAIKTADKKQIENHNFWGLFVADGMRVAQAAELFTPVRRKKSCEMLANAFTTFATVKSKTAAADAIVANLEPCGPDSKASGYSFFKMSAKEWKPVVKAAVRHIDLVKMNFFTDSYAEIVARADPLAAALLFGADWKETNWSARFMDEARYLAGDIASAGNAAELPSTHPSIAEWKYFLAQNKAKLHVVRTEPVDMWPQS